MNAFTIWSRLGKFRMDSFFMMPRLVPSDSSDYRKIGIEFWRMIDFPCMTAEIRYDWTAEEIGGIYELSLPELMFQAQLRTVNTTIRTRSRDACC